MRGLLIVAASAALILMASTALLAQHPQPPDREAPVVVQGRVASEGVPVPPPALTFQFVRSEVGFGGKIVKGAPYSAEAVTETIQTLGDGNRIVNRNTTLLYRDGEGRTRREQTLNAIGGFANGGEPIQTIFINDPVIGVSFSLDSRTNVADKTTSLKLEPKLLSPGAAIVAPGSPMYKFEYKLEAKRRAPDAIPALPVPEGEQFKVRTESGGIVYAMKRRGDDKNTEKESLGRQVIEGVEADGTRVTITIPAGEIGNERPIQMVSEQWYSPELQLVVMSKHSDPRLGETTYRLTNINRAEPAKTLFEVPPGYTVSEGLPGIMKQAPLPAKVKKTNAPE